MAAAINGHSLLKGARYTYLLIEAVHFVVWFVTLIVEQILVKGPEGGEASWIRLAHVIQSLHFVAPVTVIALEIEEGKLLSGWQFFIALTVFGTDLWSLLENVLHLEGVVYPQYVVLERALAGLCLALSILWIFWYISAYFYYRKTSSEKTSEKTNEYKKLDDEESRVVATASGTFSGPRLRQK